MSDSFESAIGLDSDTSRTPREAESREHGLRPTDEWLPQGMLPDPAPRNGMHFRWVRAEFQGNTDMGNVSKKMREGWTPVLASEFPELCLLSDIDSRFNENIQQGGLLLCFIPEEKYQARKRYYDKLSRQQMMAVNGELMRESNSVMPMDRPDHTTRVTFGRGD